MTFEFFSPRIYLNRKIRHSVMIHIYIMLQYIFNIKESHSSILHHTLPPCHRYPSEMVLREAI